MKYETQIKMIENWLQERAEKLNNCPAEIDIKFDRSASCVRYQMTVYYSKSHKCLCAFYGRSDSYGLTDRTDIFNIRSIYNDNWTSTCEDLAFDILNNWQVIKRKIEESIQALDSVENFKL